jgi:TrmH family RNA methyltransferase
MEIRRLHSANSDFQLAHSLLENRKQRAHQGRFVVEGVRAIDAAADSGWQIDSFWYTRPDRLSSWARGHLDRGAARTAYELAPSLMQQLSGKDETSELVALVDMPPDDLARLPLRQRGLVVVFDRPVLPGNVGSVIRSADALGADGVVVTGHAADVYDPQSVRAATTSLFSLPVVRAERPREVVEYLRGYRIVGTSAQSDVAIDDTDLTGATALVVGNETRGLSAGWRDECHVLATIPMSGAATSLNAAAAAAVLLYEADRQRRRETAAERA